MRQFQLKSLEDIPLKDKNVFMRVDFNVPLKGKKIRDSYRIEKSWPSIQFILEQGGHLLLASHLGRPGGKPNPDLSLNPVAEYLSQKKNLELFFIEDLESSAPKRLFPGLKSHQLILLENLRFYPGEEKLDPSFAKKLANGIDIYINEGFGISHRNHTSVALLPQEFSVKGLGFQFQKEITKLDKIRLDQVEKPFLVILGGSKLKDKIPLIESLINKTDEFLVGGLMAYTFLKAMGKPVGQTYIESDLLSSARALLERLKERGKNIFFPLDHIVENKGKIETVSADRFPSTAVGKDIGPQTLSFFQERVQKAKSLFWNGPMGFFEKKEFQSGTGGLARTIAEHKGAYRVVGGGHSALAVRDFESDIDHVSTGGGASLSYLKGEKLPGLNHLMSEFVETKDFENL